jgi:hypothetical protein
MRYLTLLLILGGCGGYLQGSCGDVITASKYQGQATKLARQYHSEAELAEVQGKGVTVQGGLSPNGCWKYRFTSPIGGYEVRLSGQGKVTTNRLRSLQKARLPKYGADSSRAIAQAKPVRFPIDISLVASGSQPYWIIEGKWYPAN